MLRFWEEKTRVHVGRMEQKQQEVEAYSTKFQSLIRRLDAATTPVVPIQNAYFMEGLNKGLKRSLALLDLEALSLEEIVQAAVRAEQVLFTSKGRKGKVKYEEADGESETDNEEEPD